MDTLFEIVRTLGAFAGLASAAFLIWDRATKHYPVALFEARPLIEGGTESRPGHARHGELGRRLASEADHGS